MLCRDKDVSCRLVNIFAMISCHPVVMSTSKAVRDLCLATTQAYMFAWYEISLVSSIEYRCSRRRAPVTRERTNSCPHIDHTSKLGAERVHHSLQPFEGARECSPRDAAPRVNTRNPQACTSDGRRSAKMTRLEEARAPLARCGRPDIPAIARRHYINHKNLSRRIHGTAEPRRRYPHSTSCFFPNGFN